MAIKDYSTTPDMNTTISGINIAEGCAPSGINNAIRQLMADVKAEKDARDAELSASASAQSAKDSQQDAAISAAQTAASNAASAASAALVSAVIEDGELVLTYGNGTVKRESLPGGMPLGIPMPYTGKDVPAGFLRADGSTYSNMRASFPEFYEWVVNSGLTVALSSYTLVEGSCGYYGLDTSTGTVRMPALAAGVFGTVEAGKYGQTVQAGLPNITGHATSSFWGRSGTWGSSGALIITSNGGACAGSSATSETSVYLSFDASKSNSIYGRSDTVQPPHVKYPWVISVYNAAVSASTAQANQFVGMLDGKADKASIVTPKAYITETWNSGANWYRKWSDGWIEQGGYYDKGANNTATASVTFPTAFSKVPLSCSVTRRNDGDYYYDLYILGAPSKTGMSFTSDVGSTFRYAYWYACGY